MNIDPRDNIPAQGYGYDSFANPNPSVQDSSASYGVFGATPAAAAATPDMLQTGYYQTSQQPGAHAGQQNNYGSSDAKTSSTRRDETGESRGRHRSDRYRDDRYRDDRDRDDSDCDDRDRKRGDRDRSRSDRERRRDSDKCRGYYRDTDRDDEDRSDRRDRRSRRNEGYSDDGDNADRRSDYYGRDRRGGEMRNDSSSARNRRDGYSDNGAGNTGVDDRNDMSEYSRMLPREYNDSYSSNYNNSSKLDIRGGEKWISNCMTTTIMLRGIATDITEQELENALNNNNIFYKEMRMMFRKDGVNRGFAFLEFHTEDQAKQFKEFHKSQLLLWRDRRALTLHYSTPKYSGGEPHARVEWTCIKCSGRNYPGRDYCFRCNLPREASENYANDGSCHVDTYPCNTLVIRYLNEITDEVTLRKSLQKLLPIGSLILNCLIIRDPKTQESLSFAFIECSTITDATIIINGINTNAPYEIHGNAIVVQYAKSTYPTLISTMPQWNKGKTGTADNFTAFSNNDKSGDTTNALNVAQRALANNKRKKIDLQKRGRKDSDSNSGYRTPDTSSFQYEPSSGFYYDPETSFYYDAKTQYFFNSQTKSYMYWDGASHTYIPVPSGPATTTADPVAATTTTTTTTVSQSITSTSQANSTAANQSSYVNNIPPDYSMVINENMSTESGKLVVDPDKKVKMARRVAKDMEKWAKAQNRNQSKLVHQAPPAAPLTSSQEYNQLPSSQQAHTVLGADIAFSMLEKKASSLKRTLDEMNANESQLAFSTRLVSQGYGSDSDIEDSQTAAVVAPSPSSRPSGSSATNSAADALPNIVSVEKKACLLCKRQFSSLEMLNKHISSSDLHKKNLEKTKTIEYRDRAKERRKIYGQNEKPDINPNNRHDKKPRSQALIEPSFEIPASATTGLDSTNVGNQLLQKMGWSQGRGLGSQGQGIVDPIKANMRNGESSGLGSRGSSYNIEAGDQHKTQKAMMARYNEY